MRGNRGKSRAEAVLFGGWFGRAVPRGQPVHRILQALMSSTQVLDLPKFTRHIQPAAYGLKRCSPAPGPQGPRRRPPMSLMPCSLQDTVVPAPKRLAGPVAASSQVNMLEPAPRGPLTSGPRRSTKERSSVPDFVLAPVPRQPRALSMRPPSALNPRALHRSRPCAALTQPWRLLPIGAGAPSGLVRLTARHPLRTPCVPWPAPPHTWKADAST